MRSIFLWGGGAGFAIFLLSTKDTGKGVNIKPFEGGKYKTFCWTSNLRTWSFIHPCWTFCPARLNSFA